MPETLADIREDAIGIELTDEQLKRIAVHGALRAVAGLLRNGNSTYQRGKDHSRSWEFDIEGAGGEYAGCLAYGLEFDWTIYGNDIRLNGRSRPDSEVGIDFRTRLGPWTDLPIFRDDPSDRIFVLVVGRLPSFYIQGWIRGSEAKQERWFKRWGQSDRTPAFLVPASELHSAESLKDVIRLLRIQQATVYA